MNTGLPDGNARVLVGSRNPTVCLLQATIAASTWSKGSAGRVGNRHRRRTATEAAEDSFTLIGNFTHPPLQHSSLITLCWRIPD